ncbi:MAG: hypothetical protein COA45_07170 [Zetaproteobacteria bacterium]|nr:MAG: hypothetical protein COA45_07170 [Zetaproteobacteria bacterium]
MLQRFVFLGLYCCVLAGCIATPSSQETKMKPVIVEHRRGTLEAWWSLFNDPVLDRLISSALSLNVPSKTASEIELSAGMPYSAFQDFHQDQSARLIIDVAQNYVRYRYAQNQQQTLAVYMSDRDEMMATLVKKKDLADTKNPHLMRIKSQDNALAKKMLHLDRQVNKISRNITGLTKLLPEYVSQILKETLSIPRCDIAPVLASSTSMIATSPEVIAARSYFMHQAKGAIKFYDLDGIFPDMAVNGFYGISDDVYVRNDVRWSVAAGHAVKSLNLQSLEDVYSGQDIYNDFRNHLFDAVMELERLIVSYALIQEQYIVLRNAAISNESDYTSLTRVGKTNAASLFDAREDVYTAEMATLRAEYEKAKLLIQIYEKLGVY